MALLGYLLQRCNPVHLNAPLLHALESLLRAVAPSEALTKQLLQQLLLNLRLWSAAPPAGQQSLQDLILKLAKANTAAAAACRAASLAASAVASVQFACLYLLLCPSIRCCTPVGVLFVQYGLTKPSF